jgi:hypothetical protein
MAVVDEIYHLRSTIVSPSIDDCIIQCRSITGPDPGVPGHMKKNPVFLRLQFLIVPLHSEILRGGAVGSSLGS